MQRMISHAEHLPACRAGHTARHIHDARCERAGGGHLIECACSTTGKYAEFSDAQAAWERAQGRAAVKRPGNVTPMRIAR